MRSGVFTPEAIWRCFASSHVPGAVVPLSSCYLVQENLLRLLQLFDLFQRRAGHAGPGRIHWVDDLAAMPEMSHGEPLGIARYEAQKKEETVSRHETVIEDPGIDSE